MILLVDMELFLDRCVTEPLNKSELRLGKPKFQIYIWYMATSKAASTKLY